MAMFSEVQQAVDSKQLHPMVRTQYMRTAFQIPYDATVRISLDTNLTMIKENPEQGPSCHEAGRCDIQHMPHAHVSITSVQKLVFRTLQEGMPP